MRFSLIKYCTHLVTPLSLIFAIFFFIRGHNAPGGGFIAGLVVATAFVLYAIAFDLRKAQRLLPGRFEYVFSFGLGLAALTGLAAVIFQSPFLSTYQADLHLGPFGKFHVVSSVFFDFGVFLVVIAVVAGFVFQFAERNCQLYWPGAEREAGPGFVMEDSEGEQLLPGWEKFAEGSVAAKAAAEFIAEVAPSDRPPSDQGIPAVPPTESADEAESANSKGSTKTDASEEEESK